MTNVKYNGISAQPPTGFGNFFDSDLHRSVSHVLSKTDKRTLSSVAVGTLKSMYPQQYKIHTPRKHIIPKGYHDPEFYQANECGRVNLHGTYNPDINDYIFNGYGIHEEGYNFHNDICSKVHIGLRHYMYPHYFVEKDLLNMLNMTSIAENVDLTKMKWPFNACLFTLPKEALIDDGTGDEVTNFAYHRSFDIQPLSYQLRAKELNPDNDSEGRIYDAPFSRKWSKTLVLEEKEREKKQAELLKEVEDIKGEPCRIMPTFSIVILYDCTEMSVCSYPISSTSFKDILKVYEDSYTVEGMPAGKMLEGRNKESEVAGIQKITKMVLGLIMYMSCRREEWSPVQKKSLRRTKMQKRMKTVLYAPNFLGKKYSGRTSKKNVTEGQRGKLKPHWRSGYMGIRWYGKGRTESKLVWTEPYPVNTN